MEHVIESNYDEGFRMPEGEFGGRRVRLVQSCHLGDIPDQFTWLAVVKNFTKTAIFATGLTTTAKWGMQGERKNVIMSLKRTLVI